MFSEWFAYTVFGLFLGAAYSIAASGLVLTYATTRVFNLAHGAISMVAGFVYWQLHVDAGLPNWLSVVLILFVLVFNAIGFAEGYLLHDLRLQWVVPIIAVTAVGAVLLSRRLL